MKTLDKIKNLISSLPSSDIAIAKKFLSTRDFESLQLLVHSSIIRVKKGLSKEKIKEEYLKVDMGKLEMLEIEVNLYCLDLGIPIQNLEDSKDFNNKNLED